MKYDPFLKTARKTEGEFAPGIPLPLKISDIPKVDIPEEWEIAIQKHLAEVAGPHEDLRLGDPKKGIGHSWFLRHWPKPGEKRLAKKQPDHTIPYFDFEGNIPVGYGKGDVELEYRDRAEILDANKDKINFSLYPGRDIQDYSLIRTKDNKWLLLNRTINRRLRPDIPSSKPDYKSVAPEKIDFKNKSQVMQDKIDGAHELFVLDEGKPIKVFSYRPAENREGLIDHTPQIQILHGKKTPKGIKDTILRGEIFAINPRTGRATLQKDLSGILNSSVRRSRDIQKKLGTLEPVIYDVVKSRGQNMEDAPYRDKLNVLLDVNKKIPLLELPDMAFSEKEKKLLLEAIQEKKKPRTKEGIVLWNLDAGVPPIKSVWKPTFDVFVRGINTTKSDNLRGKMAGGFRWSWTPDGPIVGSVKSGLTHAELTEMFRHPEHFIGRVAKLEADEKFPDSKNLRKPVFVDWHLDKGKQPYVKESSVIEDLNLISGFLQTLHPF